MSESKMSFSLPGSAVIPTEQALVMSSIPDGYKVELSLDGGYFIYPWGMSAAHPIGRVDMINGELIFVLFEGNNFSKPFMSALAKKFPAYDPERIVWAVFFEWYGKWSMVNQPGDDKLDQVRNLSYFHLERKPVLCSFRANDFDGTTVLTITTQRIWDNWQICDIDEGPTLIELTNLESTIGDLNDGPSEIFRIGPEDLDILE